MGPIYRWRWIPRACSRGTVPGGGFFWERSCFLHRLAVVDSLVKVVSHVPPVKLTSLSVVHVTVARVSCQFCNVRDKAGVGEERSGPQIASHQGVERSEPGSHEVHTSNKSQAVRQWLQVCWQIVSLVSSGNTSIRVGRVLFPFGLDVKTKHMVGNLGEKKLKQVPL